ncbi:redoxin domain-containing protein [Chitinophaga sp. SYP-B3965]|uniref:TlpA disulfide reductase family protein n=1 Tax=Chitinophaga sp. SYP-B3965 TaxID=2663120 RepID=UPI00129975AF|nr:TlpA disulfide reductase family protein [Chitinophaga sp. SYP-B3965]MRG48804.1 redoxin domain-containing protein [Chitinophaga sp. SYP-B3965]
MKHILIILLLLPLLSLGQEKEYHLKGHMRNWKGQDSIAVIYIKNNALVIDTIIATDGRFEIKGKLEQPVSTGLRSMKPMKRNEIADNIRFYLEPGVLLLEGTDSLRYSQLKTHEVNADHKKLESATKPFLDRLMELRRTAMATPKEKQQTPAFKELEAEYKALQDSMKQTQIRFVKANPKSFISLEAITQLAGATMNYSVTAPLFESLDPSLKQLPLGKDLDAKLTIAKKTKIGTVMPSFTSLDTARNELHLNDVVSKGKVTLVDFWASWCAPCRAENPNVVKAFNSFHPKGFEIISVSLDDNAQRWKDAIVKDGMPWYHVSGLKKWQEPVAVFFGISAVPDNFLLDAKGRVVARGLKGEALYKKIEEMTR